MQVKHENEHRQCTNKLTIMTTGVHGTIFLGAKVVLPEKMTSIKAQRAESEVRVLQTSRTLT